MVKTEDVRRFRWTSLLVILAIVIVFEFGFNNFGLGFRFINDYYDRSNFLQIGSWILNDQIPYVDKVIEFPQIPVYFFGLLNWLAKTILPTTWPVGAGFMVLWLLFTSVILWVAIGQVWQLLPVGRKKLAWLMFLPAAIYFSMNRFDILPVLISLLAVMAINRKRFTLAALLLSIGVFTKWYMAFFFPLFLIFEWRHTGKFPWRSVLTFSVSSILILLPTFITGGWDALLQPYTWHLERLVEPGTLLWLVYRALGVSESGWIKPGLLGQIFTLLSFSGFLLIFLKRIDSIQKVMVAVTISLLIFILFTRIFSPQWWLWVLPFLIITSNTKVDLSLIVLYDLIDYVAFPVLYDLAGSESIAYLTVTGMLMVLLVVFIVRSIIRLNRTEGRVAP